MKKIFILLLLLFRFASMHPALGETESIMALSDTHLTKQTRDHADMLQAVMQAAQGKDLVLLTGDNTDNAHTEEHAMVLEWAGMMEQQTGAGCRVRWPDTDAVIKNCGNVLQEDSLHTADTT